MKKILLLTLLLTLFSRTASATSLDDIYRDLVKSENQGYLPMFVKNRNAPDFLENSDVKSIEPEVKVYKEKTAAPVILINERKIKDEEAKLDKSKWETALDNIRINQVTPADLAAIEEKVNTNDGKAIEIYAWMLARGIGVEQDLNKSFELYQKAALLRVPDATKNAAMVYRAMKPDQREKVKPLEIEEE